MGRLLGHNSAYPTRYAPDVLEPISRELGRSEIKGAQPWRYAGEDVWTAYEVAYLGPGGRPQVAMAELHVPCTSPNIIESKSLKLYLFSLNNEVFSGREAFAKTVCGDLSRVTGSHVTWVFCNSHDPRLMPAEPKGRSIDAAPFVARSLDEATLALHAGGPNVAECLHSELLRSLCPVTAQPDWGTVTVDYEGPQIDYGTLLSYVAAYRNHQGFHEQCVERIFMDIKRLCRCKELTVYARYTRRGGLDINPVRTTRVSWPKMSRDWRQ